MTDPDTHRDGPPVFLPEPPRHPSEPPETEAPVPEPEHPGTLAPGSGQRLDEVSRRRGIPFPVLAFVLVVTLMISIKEGTFLPMFIGLAFLFFLRRQRRR